MNDAATVVEVQAAVAAGEADPAALVLAAWFRVRDSRGVADGITAVVDEPALRADLAAVAARRAAGEPLPLDGVALAVKELHDVAGLPTTLGSAALPARPAGRDTVVVARLRAAGAVVVAKTNTSELGWKPLTDSPAHGRTEHPLDAGRLPGGSSGGSAAAVARGLVPLATGSDGGGSLRIPAALCGLATLKPSVPGPLDDPGTLWPDLSADGVLAASVDDLVAAHAVLGWRPAPAADRPRRVAWVPDLGAGAADPAVEAVVASAVGRLAGAGWEVEPVAAPLDSDPLDAWLALTGEHHRRVLAGVAGTPAAERLDPGLRAQLEAALARPAGELEAARRRRDDVARRLIGLAGRYDAVLTPTVASTAPDLDGRAEIAGRRSGRWVRFTYPVNLAGLPAASIPVPGGLDGWPVGLHLVGGAGRDAELLAVVAEAAAVLGTTGAPGPAR